MALADAVHQLHDTVFLLHLMHNVGQLTEMSDWGLEDNPVDVPIVLTPAGWRGLKRKLHMRRLLRGWGGRPAGDAALRARDARGMRSPLAHAQKRELPGLPRNGRRVQAAHRAQRDGAADDCLGRACAN